MTELEATLHLNALPGFGPRIISELLKHFGSARAVLTAPEGALAQVKGFREGHLASFRRGIEAGFVENQLRQADTLKARIIPFSSPGYPDNLKNIHDPPVVLHVWGDLLPEDQNGVGLVGTRNASDYGAEVSRMLAIDLALAGVTVVSGLARGVDSAAHAAALDHGGRTVAVLGSGLDFPLSRQRGELMERIAAQGAVVSEFPFGTPADPGHFPRRNRIISGLSRAVVVVEAGEKSGALITADYALDQGVDLYAVPGPITNSLSAGCNRLIQEGARPVLSGADLLLSLGRKPNPKEPAPALLADERKVFDLLAKGPLHFDQIARESKLPVTDLHTLLFGLEVKGVVAQRQGMRYSIAN